MSDHPMSPVLSTASFGTTSLTHTTVEPRGDCEARWALESGAWAFQLAVIGYQVTASMLLVGPTSQTALIAALAVPPTAYLVRDLRSRKWITPPSRASRAVLALSCLLQAFWLFGIIHRYAPELIRSDTPLVALGFPYLAIGLLRTDRRLGVGLLPLLFAPVSLAAALCGSGRTTGRSGWTLASFAAGALRCSSDRSS